MDVAVIGAGNMGRSLARRLTAGGHTVHLCDRDPKDAGAVAQEMAANGGGAVRPQWSARDAVDASEVVILAAYFADNKKLAVELSDALAGKIVVDISNPLNPTFDGLVTEPTTSAAEEMSRRLPGARLVKAFNTTFAPVLFDGAIDGTPLDVFIASDDDEAKQTVADLVSSMEMRPVDAGALQNSRTLERMLLLLIELQGRYGLEFSAGVKFLPEKLNA